MVQKINAIIMLWHWSEVNSWTHVINTVIDR